MDVPQKVTTLHRLHLCLNCLAQSHTRSHCRSLERCWRCSQFHHSLLHPIPDEHVWFPMTARVRVITWKGRRARNTRVVIDPDSPRSYIALKEALDMHCIINDSRTTVTLCHQYLERRQVQVRCVVQDRDFGYSPPARIDREFNMPHRIPGAREPADRWWYSRDQYFMILGADVSREIFIRPTVAQSGRIFTQVTVFGQAYFGEGRKSNI